MSVKPVYVLSFQDIRSNEASARAVWREQAQNVVDTLPFLGWACSGEAAVVSRTDALDDVAARLDADPFVLACDPAWMLPMPEREDEDDVPGDEVVELAYGQWGAVYYSRDDALKSGVV